MERNATYDKGRLDTNRHYCPATTLSARPLSKSHPPLRTVESTPMIIWMELRSVLEC